MVEASKFDHKKKSMMDFEPKDYDREYKREWREHTGLAGDDLKSREQHRAAVMLVKLLVK